MTEQSKQLASKKMAAILSSVLFLSVGLSHALYENISYQDIILRAAQFQQIGFQQEFENYLKDNPASRIFLDSMPFLKDSKALTPWGLLHNGAKQDLLAKNNTCCSRIEEMISVAMKKETWAFRSE